MNSDTHFVKQGNENFYKNRTKTGAKMFYKTYTARKPPSMCTPITPSLPGCDEWCRLQLDDVMCSVRTRLTMAQQFFPFLSLVTYSRDI